MLAVLLSALVLAPPALLPHVDGWNGATARIRYRDCRGCVQVDS